MVRARHLAGNQPLSLPQRGPSLWLGASLMLIGAGVAVISALQFRAVIRGLGEKEDPRGYWTNLGAWLYSMPTGISLVLAVPFVCSI